MAWPLHGNKLSRWACVQPQPPEADATECQPGHFPDPCIVTTCWPLLTKMPTHSKVQSFVSSTRNVFLKCTSPKHKGTSAIHPKPSASISKSDKILEQLSQSLAPIHFDAGDLNRDTPDQRTGMLASSVSAATNVSEGRYNPDAVCTIYYLLAIDMYAKIGSGFYHQLRLHLLVR